MKRTINKNKYRVNYLLSESFHYSLVEAETEKDAEEFVYDALGKPEQYELLGTEESQEAQVIKEGPDYGMAQIINGLIIDEWEAINAYNTASVTAQNEGLEDAAKLFADLSKEEVVHVGELQELLKSFDVNTHAIDEGEAEAKEKLEESIKELDEIDKAKAVTIIDSKYHTTFDEFMNNLIKGKYDDKLDFTVSEPLKSIEIYEKDVSNGKGKVFHRYFIDSNTGDIEVWVNVK